MVASPHALVDPPRSCWVDDDTPGEGGVWHYPREKSDNGNVLFKTDLLDVMSRAALPLTRHMLRSEIKAKLVRGANGKLTYGHGGQYDVSPFMSVNHVLELRLEKFMGDDPIEQLHTRIYFNEPASEPKVLKLLALTCKHGGDSPAVHHEQNGHAQDAYDRLDACTFVTLEKW